MVQSHLYSERKYVTMQKMKSVSPADDRPACPAQSASRTRRWSGHVEKIQWGLQIFPGRSLRNEDDCRLKGLYFRHIPVSDPVSHFAPQRLHTATCARSVFQI